LDACPGDHWTNLADSLPDHPPDVWLRVRSDVSRQSRLDDRFAICHQSRGESDIYADPIRHEELASCSSGHPDRLDNNHLAGSGDLAALPMGESRTDPVFHLGLAGDRAATFDHFEQSLKKTRSDMIHQILALPLMILMGSFVMAEETPTVLFDFTGAEPSKQWQNVNDNVMGGVSEGKFKITDSQTLEFYGKLSLENNGGFASVRTKAKKLGLRKGDTVVTRVRGDGREYQMNLYVPTIQIAYSYRSVFSTKKDEWIEIKLPLEKFEATSFGQIVKNAAQVDPPSVNGIGFLLNDKKAGPFKLEVEWIKVERSGK